MRPGAHSSHHPRIDTRSTEKDLPSPSRRGGGQGRLWTLALPSLPHLPHHLVMHSYSRPSAQFWGAHR